MTRVLQLKCMGCRHLLRTALAFVWFAGLSAGIFLCKKAAPFFLPLMRGMSIGSVSIVGLIVSAAIPFLISAFAVMYFSPPVLFAGCFLKALGFMLFSLLLILHFGEGGWLVQLFVLFHEIAGIPILYLFWIRSFRFGKLPPISECLGLFSLEILVITTTYRVMVPFLSGLKIL